MTRCNFLFGISMAALAAGTAHAQANSSTVNNSSDPAALSTVTVDNNRAGNEGNASLVNTAGANNTVVITQLGDNNTSTATQSGRSNEIYHYQTNPDNAEVGNSAESTQIGDNNLSTPDNHYSDIRQNGRRNFAQVEQTTSAAVGVGNNQSVVQQGQVEDTDGATRGVQPVAVGVIPVGFEIAVSNTATVAQRGSNNNSTINQFRNADSPTAAAGNGLVSGNTASVTMGDPARGRPLSQGGLSTINQRARGDTATVSLFEGVNAGDDQAANRNNQRNRSTITQGNRTAAGAGTDFAGPSGAALAATANSGNRATVSISGFANSSSVLQNGNLNVADVTMQQGGPGSTNDATLTRGQFLRSKGNTSNINQTGSRHSAVVVYGSRQPDLGQANLGTVTQTGNRHSATLYSRGIFDTATITQGDSAANSQSAATDVTVNRGVADVSQLGDNNAVTVNQTGDNLATVTQGLGAGSRTTITQQDAGDRTTQQVGFITTVRASNEVNIAQYGDAAQLDINQNAVDAGATVFQRAGMVGARSNDNRINIQQGTSGTEGGQAAPLQADGTDAFGVFFTGDNTAVTGGTGTVNVFTSVEQGNANTSVSRNRADVRQDGVNLNATVTQRGSASVGSMRTNNVFIAQQGTGNSATGVQAAGVGPSGVTAPASGTSAQALATNRNRAAGAQSAEIVILQRSTGNNASVLQEGLGQYARIEQSGSRNTASLTQTASATNATGVIIQTGNDNTFSETQTAAGAFVHVTQSGNGNSTITTVR